MSACSSPGIGGRPKPEVQRQNWRNRWRHHRWNVSGVVFQIWTCTYIHLGFTATCSHSHPYLEHDRLLKDIFRISARAEHTVGDAEEPATVCTEDLCQRVHRALPHLRDMHPNRKTDRHMPL